MTEIVLDGHVLHVPFIPLTLLRTHLGESEGCPFECPGVNSCQGVRGSSRKGGDEGREPRIVAELLQLMLDILLA